MPSVYVPHSNTPDHHDLVEYLSEDLERLQHEKGP